MRFQLWNMAKLNTLDYSIRYSVYVLMDGWSEAAENKNESFVSCFYTIFFFRCLFASLPRCCRCFLFLFYFLSQCVCVTFFLFIIISIAFWAVLTDIIVQATKHKCLLESTAAIVSLSKVISLCWICTLYTLCTYVHVLSISLVLYDNEYNICGNNMMCWFYSNL